MSNAEMPDADRAHPRLQVFVHLARGHDAASWERKWRSGELLGINERTPYGYEHANELGCTVSFSQDSQEKLPGLLTRGVFRVLFGFDLVHAYRNRAGLAAADVIWTHTESQHLAILALFRLLKSPAPRIICQSVWLMDRWPKLSPMTKKIYRSLLSRADVLTFLSPSNRQLAEQEFPDKRCVFIPFGIRAEIQSKPRLIAGAAPFKIFAAGNDRHRDWATLVEAVGGREEFVLKIASQKIPASLVKGRSNVEVVSPKTNDELKALFSWADAMVIPLTENFHASGITVLEEAALFGLPSVCTRVGGIDAYFRDDEVAYVGPRNAEELRKALFSVCTHPEDSMAMAQRAQDRMRDDDLSSKAYVARHVELSREILGVKAR